MNDTPETDALAAFWLDTAPQDWAALARRLERERDEARKLILDHNIACANLCGETEAEKGVRCQYRNYFPRRCPECPEANWMIDMPWTLAATRRAGT